VIVVASRRYYCKRTLLINDSTMASIQTPILPYLENDAAYDEATKWGTIHPDIAQNEERSLHAVQGPTSGGATENDYEDKHVLVSASNRTLIVKHYLITHSTLVVDIDKIVWIHPASNVCKALSVKCWGVGITGIAWARDLHRMFPTGRAWEHSFVVKSKDAWLGMRTGFTVEDAAKFVETLERILPGISTRPVEEDKKDKAERDHAGYSQLEEDSGTK